VLLRVAQRVQVDVSGLQRAASVINGPRWVDGIVSDFDEGNRRVTVLLQYPIEGKKSFRVALVRVKSD
jgi:hypothetical protein